MAKIPVVDFSLCSVDKQDIDEDSEDFRRLAHDITEAFSTVGFLYLKNHGIVKETVTTVFDAAKQFFLLPPETKQKYRLVFPNGWLPSEQESLKPGSPGDLKESFNYCPAQPMNWPDEEVPEFQARADIFQALCETVARRLMLLLAVGLGLEPSFFSDRHKSLRKENASALRWLYYPPLPQHFDIKPAQLRCGEHSDYGTLTLLFQDAVGGLEVLNCENNWIPGTPISGSIVVNIGALMQRWTADRLKATIHRVVIPSLEVNRQDSRQSLAYFIQPDDTAMIEPVDGSGKYPPISAADYIYMRFKEVQN